jgi:hypothetical protein
MKKQYCCEASRHLFNQYYSNQQKGGSDFPVYVGRARQRGHGLANIFKNIWSFLFLAIKTIAPHTMRAGADFVEDIGNGTNWRESAMTHGSTVVKPIPDAVSADVAARRNQSGSDYRRRRSKHAKRFKRDIFS